MDPQPVGPPEQSCGCGAPVAIAIAQVVTGHNEALQWPGGVTPDKMQRWETLKKRVAYQSTLLGPVVQMLVHRAIDALDYQDKLLNPAIRAITSPVAKRVKQQQQLLDGVVRDLMGDAYNRVAEQGTRLSQIENDMLMPQTAETLPPHLPNTHAEGVPPSPVPMMYTPQGDDEQPRPPIPPCPPWDCETWSAWWVAAWAWWVAWWAWWQRQQAKRQQQQQPMPGVPEQGPAIGVPGYSLPVPSLGMLAPSSSPLASMTPEERQQYADALVTQPGGPGVKLSVETGLDYVDPYADVDMEDNA